MEIQIKYQDICLATEPAILQQCCCIARKPHGLSATLNKKFPYCKVYVNRPGKTPNTASTPATPGTLEHYFGDGPTIICAMAQYGHGMPGAYPYHGQPDTAALRLQWFEECLAKIDNVSSIAVPFGIGCGLAGGNWPAYYKLLEKLNERIPVVLYQI